MGLVKAAIDSVGGAFAGQWKDFLTVPAELSPTAALFPAVRAGANANRGSGTRGSNAILSNGSKIVVPEGYGLLLFQDGELTAFAGDPGAYIWASSDMNSLSIFADDDPSESLIQQSWERFKFGGQPGSQQLALFVNLKELPNNKFGTQSEIYWDDAYFNAQVGALTHGTYSISITDPILFAKRFVPARYLQGQDIFDFTDRGNSAASQLFSEVISSLAAAFSRYANHPDRANRMSRIQQDSIGFAESLSSVVEEAYKWTSTRGIGISKVNLVGVKYDENTKELLRSVQRADALAGTRGNANLQASVAAGMQSAGEARGAEGLLGLGVAAGSVNLPALMHQTPAPVTSTSTAESDSDLITVLGGLKRAFEAGLINQAEFDAAKAKALGLS
ncbi:SPFH domain-containing protein [Arthrobacter sp. zg-Y820]|nr:MULTISPECIES: SPFH domain-containing protein [unclassified Arthrobacter]MCC9195301.1 SPFH domain-containing protein [Arthrobacter sp. zg-Y820]MDK1278160.1 SPFH domain-containing protein [Arthrobacter sp. zg.Y820]MDK1361362.1 SPFH domain-containing protein [Arthrobacter sp. zg-Y1219]WIB11048.1 SPFH domain-containing protein [Arthrobacter sp. zg-Y820]